jgi:hypothetical protein
MAKQKRTRRATPIYRKASFWAAVVVLLTAAFILAGTFFSHTFSLGGDVFAKRGSVKIVSIPGGATISFDGKKLDEKTDSTITKSVGKHTIKLELSGYDTQEIVVDIVADQTANVAHVFTKNGNSPSTEAPAGQASTKEYTNGPNGYSLTYPFDWSLEESPSGVVHFYNAGITKQLESKGIQTDKEAYESLAILVQPNSSRLDPEGWYKTREEYAAEDQSQIKQKAITVGGRSAYQYETPYGFTPYVITVFTSWDKAILLQQKLESPDRSAYDQIVNSFRIRREPR